MRSIRCTPCLLLLAWLLTLAPSAAVAVESMALATVPESGISVSLEGWAGLTPTTTTGRDAGLLPIVVLVTNSSLTDRVWTVGPGRGFSNGTSIVPVTQLEVAAGSVGRTTLYVDPGPSDRGGGMWLTIRGFGLVGGEQQVRIDAWNPSFSSGSSGTPESSRPHVPAAVSRTVSSHARRGTAFDAYHEAVGLGLDLASAPDDWRGWSVFAGMLLDESEWIAMSAGQRKAFLDWIGLGGQAGLLVTDSSAPRLDQIGLPAADSEGRRRVGAGEILPLPWNGNELTPADIAPFLDGRPLHPRSDQLAAYSYGSGPTGSDQWGTGFQQLFAVFGPRQLPVVAILCFLGIFGVVAGPLNLLVFAGPGRRSRMFVTTPLISLLATLLLLGLIFLRDGVGGAGARRVLCLLMPEQNGMAIVQEQFSRTGVLLSSSFPIGEPSWMRPLGTVASDQGLLEVDGRERRGDWFTSRADQGYLLETVRPSRAQLELLTASDAAPAVISSIDAPLDRLFVIDEEGAYWTATEVSTGEQKTLEPSTAQAYTEWFRGIAAEAGPTRTAALSAVRNRRGHAYAESSAAAVAVDTLGSIRWIDDSAVFIGPFMRTTAP